MLAKVVDMIKGSRTRVLIASLAIAAFIALVPAATSAAPSPEVAKDCLRAAYMLYPYKRPGAAPMNGERLSFFRNCVAKQQASNSAAPSSENSPAPSSK